MGRYINKFKVGDEVVCNHNYAWLRKGTIYKVRAVNRTGSIQLFGTSGNYVPDNFYLAPTPKGVPLYIAIYSGRFTPEKFIDHYSNGVDNAEVHAQYVIGPKDKLEELIHKGLEDVDDHDFEEQWIVARLDSTLKIKAEKKVTFTTTSVDL